MPATKDGTLAPTDGTLIIAQSTVTAKIGSAAAASFTGLTRGFIGLAQMNIVVPALAPGVYPLTVTIDGQTPKLRYDCC